MAAAREKEREKLLIDEVELDSRIQKQLEELETLRNTYESSREQKQRAEQETEQYRARLE